MGKKEIDNPYEGGVEFDLVNHTTPYEIYLRGSLNQFSLDLKSAKNTRYELLGVLYYFRMFEHAFYVFKDKIKVENAHLNENVLKFLNQLIDLKWIEKKESVKVRV